MGWLRLYNKDISIGAHFLHGPPLVLLPLSSKNHNYWSNLRWIQDIEMEYDVIQNTLTEHIPCDRYYDTHWGSKGLRVTSQECSCLLGALYPEREKDPYANKYNTDSFIDQYVLSAYSELGTGLGNWKFRPTTIETFLQLWAYVVYRVSSQSDNHRNNCRIASVTSLWR